MTPNDGYSHTNHLANLKIKIEICGNIGDPKSGRVRISDGQKMAGYGMVGCYSGFYQLNTRHLSQIYKWFGLLDVVLDFTI